MNNDPYLDEEMQKTLRRMEMIDDWTVIVTCRACGGSGDAKPVPNRTNSKYKGRLSTCKKCGGVGFTVKKKQWGE